MLHNRFVQARLFSDRRVTLRCVSSFSPCEKNGDIQKRGCIVEAPNRNCLQIHIENLSIHLGSDTMYLGCWGPRIRYMLVIWLPTPSRPPRIPRSKINPISCGRLHFCLLFRWKQYLGGDNPSLPFVASNHCR